MLTHWWEMRCLKGSLEARRSGLQQVEAIHFTLSQYLNAFGFYSCGFSTYVISGELLIGPARVLFMDEISNGLDSSTTYQIIKYLRHSTCALDGTTIISLLQPAPETYELFDDVILLCEGQIIYQGPRDSVLDFFASMGFSCPKRKNVADFLQEVSGEDFKCEFILFYGVILLNFWNTGYFKEGPRAILV